MATKVKLIADGVITPDQITLTTASTGTNTTAPATTAFVQQEISALVDSSPDALNTLNELAAALGDDANFSTTVTNSIATKLPLAGGTLTGDLNFGDNDKAVFGAGSDLQIFSDGTDSFVQDTGTGILRLKSNGSKILMETAGGETLAEFINNGNTVLYSNNVERLRTNGSGIDVTGNATFDDDGKALFGAGFDLQIYHNGDNSFIDEAGTGILYIRAATDLRLTNRDSSKLYANFEDGGASKLYHDNALSIFTTTSGAEIREALTIGSSSNDLGTTAGNQLTPLTLRSDTANVDSLLFTTERLADGSNWETAAHRIQRKVDATKMGYIQFGSGGSDLVTFGEGSTEYVRIDGAGQLGVGVSPLAKFHVNKDGTGQILALFSSDLGVNNRNFSILSPATDSASEPFEFSTGNSFQFTIDGSSALRIRDDGGIAIGENNTGYAGQILSVKSGTGDLVMYGESSDASCGISLRDNSSSLNITWAAEGNDHVLKKDATVYMRVYASDDNLALGHIALESNTSGVSNTGIGTYALRENTSGGYNTAIGAVTLRDNLTGSNLTAVGYGALVTNTASNNTGVGYKALHITTTGANNTAVGSSALLSNTTGYDNVAVGRNALDANVGGHSNTALGESSLTSNTSGIRNVAIGQNAMAINSTGTENVAIGRNALDANTTASYNTAVGDSALTANTTGTSNTALGALSLDANTTANNNTAVGREALTSSDANNNTGIGYRALYLNTTGTGCTAVGANSLDANTTAENNTGVGFHALSNVTTGIANTAVGSVALQSTTGTITNCVAVGCEALRNSSGNRNIGIGNESGRFATGNNNVVIGNLAADATTFSGANNVAIGGNAMTRTTSGYNGVAIGYDAMAYNTTGQFNTAVGVGAMGNITTGQQNVAVGYHSCVAQTTGLYNTAIGLQSGRDVTTGSDNVFLGYRAGDGPSPSGSITTQSNRIVMGNNSATHAYILIDWTVTSDKRDKTDIEPLSMGLDLVNKLNPVTYRWDMRSDYEDGNPDGTHKKEKLHGGLLAQDVEELEREYGYKVEDETSILTDKNADGNYGLTYAKFIPVLINAVKELSSQVDELKAEIQTLKGE